MDYDDIIDNEPPRRKDDEKKIQMPKKDILNIINDIFLTNYWCTRKNMINISSDYIVGLNEIKKWRRLFNNVGFDEINNIDNRYNRDNKLDDCQINVFLKIHASPIYDILNIGNGKISLCGGAITSLLNGDLPNDYDIFFHSDSVDESDDVFNECLKYLDEKYNNKYYHYQSIIYNRSQYIMDVKINSDNFNGTIQFIKRVYKTKEQILFGFDLAPSRLGYNPKDGVFSTICGAMALSMRAFALDINIRSKSFGYRLEKYVFNKKYKVLLPQLENNLVKNDDRFEIFDNIILCKSNYNDNGNNDFIIRNVDVCKNDYENSSSNNFNLIIEKDYACITFSSESLQIISELPDDFIEQVMMLNSKLSTKPSIDDNISKKEAKIFLDDRYNEFAQSYYVDENDIKSDSIWKEKVKYYIDIAKEHTKNIDSAENYYKGWKYLNSGSKYFGQNYPVNSPPSKYYKPLVIGITMDKFQAFMDCRKNIEYIFNLPKELFGLICEYWLKYEADDARNRLLMLQPIKPIKNNINVNDIDLSQFMKNKRDICDVVFS
jgi:hypothetical protein